MTRQCAERHHLWCVDESCDCICHVPDEDDGDPQERWEHNWWSTLERGR